MAPTDTPHPRFARMYPRCAARADARGGVEHRRRLVAGLSGRVVEVGAGHGANFAHYPAAVAEVVAVEPEPTLRGLAEAAARTAPVPVTVVAGTAEVLPGEGYDAAVASLVLCSVPDQGRALAEIRRVLRPAGELRFYEHVVPAGGPKRWALQLADRSGLWPRLAAGCHPARDTAAAIGAAGFEIVECERIEFRGAAVEPAIPYLTGVARSPVG
jgi:SAM-dependent methyltransferase